MEKRQVASMDQYFSLEDGIRECVEVTIVEKELPMQQWPKEQFIVERRNRNVGALTLQIIASRKAIAEGGSAKVAFDFAGDGTITMADIEQEEKLSVLKRVRNLF